MLAPFRSLNELASLFSCWQRHPIASRDLPGTVARFWRWQLGSACLDCRNSCPGWGSTSLVIETGMTGATMNLYCGLHEAADTALVLQVLCPADTFLDVEANVGTHTIMASTFRRNRSSLRICSNTYPKLLSCYA